MAGSEEKLFLISRSETSRREAHIAEELDSVWLYLTLVESKEIDNSVWLLNTPKAPADPCKEPYRSQAAPPPLPARFVVPGAVSQVAGAGHWGFLWSGDGQAVAALLDGNAVGFVVAGHRRGRSRFVSDGGEPWGLPWDQGIFDTAFGRDEGAVH